MCRATGPKRLQRERNKTRSVQNPAPYRGHPKGAYTIRRMLPVNGKNSCRQRELILDARHIGIGSVPVCRNIAFTRTWRLGTANENEESKNCQENDDFSFHSSDSIFRNNGVLGPTSHRGETGACSAGTCSITPGDPIQVNYRLGGRCCQGETVNTLATTGLRPG